MKQRKTVKIKTVKNARSFDKTLEIYSNALPYLLRICRAELDMPYNEPNKPAQRMIELMIHASKKNPNPKYADFDKLLYKFPSCLRRAAITSAHGKWQPWRSNNLNWEKERSEAIERHEKLYRKAPACQFDHKDFPVLCKDSMFKQENGIAYIKAFKSNDWVCRDVELRKVDLKKRGAAAWKPFNPKLVKKGGKHYLRFTFEKETELHSKKDLDARILSVDLGLANTAACGVMDRDGTVAPRKSIKQAAEKDHFHHLANQLKKFQRRAYGAKCTRHRNKNRGLQTQLANDASHKIIQFAEEDNVDAIVFECLGKMKVPKGMFGAKRLRFKLHCRRKAGIQNKAGQMAHCRGMRLSRVLAAGASKYAFDGSGEAEERREKICAHSQQAGIITLI
ncbi:MAG: hypothetical protein LBU32_11085 [Clostridiales bacterium]|jgi:hypothetical protein|nr:hypothetical protein [Clostridiales bacterium]